MSSYHKKFNNINEFINNNNILFLDIINDINEYCFISLLIRYSIFINKPLKIFDNLIKVKNDYLIILFNEFKKFNNINFDIQKILKVNIN